MQSTQLYLIRHAESQGNAHFEAGLGRLPNTEFGSDLTDLGVSQAEALAKDLQTVSFASIYSSPLRRAVHTAEILSQGRQIAITIDPLLREAEKESEANNIAVNRFLNKIILLVQAHQGQTIAVVTHGFVIRLLLTKVGMNKLAEMPHGYVQNTGYIKFEVDDGGFRLIETKRVGQSH